MELLLALAVITALIIFGAMISLGNERQRRAIDDLREQVVLWAIQDLHIKREHLAREVRVDDPLGWLNRIASKVVNENLTLQVGEAYNEPCALFCVTDNGSERVIFTPLSLDDIQCLKNGKRNRLSQGAAQNPLFALPRRARVYEISILNGGILFDRELPLAWNGLTGQVVNNMERLWMYRMG